MWIINIHGRPINLDQCEYVGISCPQESCHVFASFGGHPPRHIIIDEGSEDEMADALERITMAIIDSGENILDMR